MPRTGGRPGRRGGASAGAWRSRRPRPSVRRWGSPWPPPIEPKGGLSLHYTATNGPGEGPLHREPLMSDEVFRTACRTVGRRWTSRSGRRPVVRGPRWTGGRSRRGRSARLGIIVLLRIAHESRFSPPFDPPLSRLSSDTNRRSRVPGPSGGGMAGATPIARGSPESAALRGAAPTMVHGGPEHFQHPTSDAWSTVDHRPATPGCVAWMDASPRRVGRRGAGGASRSDAGDRRASRPTGSAITEGGSCPT